MSAQRRFQPPEWIRASRPWRAAASAYRRVRPRQPAGTPGGPGVQARASYEQGWAFEDREEWIGAAAAYRQAILLDGHQRPEWLFRLGRALERSGDWYGARHAYRQAAAGRRDLPGRRRSKVPVPNFKTQVDLSLIRRPGYAYCLHKAATQAAALGLDRITAIELGVAGGNGLLAMERHSRTVERLTGVAVDILGFDTGQGLFEPQGYRDMPYYFAKGSYAMDVEALTARLDRAELVLGDAAETFRDLLAGRKVAPIGVVSFDMDYYSPTAVVLRQMGDTAPADLFLPRVSVYFDDVVGAKGQDYNRFTGELLAIDEFNAANAEVKLAEDRYFRSLPVNFSWHHSIYILHRFNHPSYETYLRPKATVHIPLR